MEKSGQLHAPPALCPGKDPPSIHWVGCWVDPRVDLDVVAKRKSPYPAGNQTLVIQPIP